MSAPIPILDNAAPNCGRCSGASHEFVTGNAATSIGPGAALDMGATPARGCVEPQRHSHRLGRGLLRGVGILRPPHGSDLHGAAERDLCGRARAHSERRAREGADPDLVAVLGRHGAHRRDRHCAGHRHGAVAHVGIRARSLHPRALCHPAHRPHSADHPVGGLGIRRQVTILVSVAVFPITVNTYSGIRDVRGAMLEIGRAYGATEWQIFWKIVLPAAIPFIMAGIRPAVGLAIIGIIVAEFFTAISGLGGMIVEYANVFATAKLFVPIIVIALVGVVLTELVMWLERRMSRWRQLERERF